jgi:hypothetical protein
VGCGLGLVHHRCITRASSDGVTQHCPRIGNRMMEPLERVAPPGRRRIRLRGLLRENLQFAGFSYSGEETACITGASRPSGASIAGLPDTEECRQAKRLVEPNPGAVSSNVRLAQKGVCLMSKLTQPSHRRTRGTYVWSSSHGVGCSDATRRAPATRAVADAPWTQRSAFAPRL